ncbi:MAG: hypothetical protein ABIP53_10140 [Candidatus Limnocylindrales bacterium]
MAGRAVFLVLHHLLIIPIWFIAPAGVVMAVAGGAAVGAAYSELRPSLPRWRHMTVPALTFFMVLMLAHSIVMAEIRGPIYSMESSGGRLLVPAPEAAADIVVGLLGTTAFTGAIIGGLIARTRRAAMITGLATFALALGPGHNIPLLGGTLNVAKELAILGTTMVVASVVVVVAHTYLLGRIRTG